MEGLGFTILLGSDAIFTTPRGRQPDASANLMTSGPESLGDSVGPVGLLTAFPESPVLPTSKKPAVSSTGGSNRVPDTESAPKWPMGLPELGAAHTSSPLSSPTLSLRAPAEITLSSSAEPGSPFLAGQGASSQQEPTETMLATSLESTRPLELW
jgi:hypothetical protein